MPAYHSSFLQSHPDAPTLSHFAVLPIRNTVKSRPVAPTTEDPDIVDEALYVYRANCFFKQFEIQGAADRTLVYLLFVLHEYLSKLTLKTTKDEAALLLMSQSSQFACPGDPGFTLTPLFPPPPREQQEPLKNYLLQLRMELAQRFVPILYPNDVPSKWWFSFTKRKFMNKSLV